MGRKAVNSNELFIENFEIPVEDRIGEEGSGFEYILHGMNPERILIAAEAVGLGQVALARASDYAKSRIVFNRPIGMNQAIQHPLAKNWMELEAAWLMVMSAGWQYDQGLPCGAAANAAKYLAAEAGFQRLRAGGDDPWRLRLRQGISCRALLARIPDPAHRPDQPAARFSASSPRRCWACRSRIEVDFSVVIPGRAQRRDPESRDSGFASSDAPGMTSMELVAHELHHRRRIDGLRQARRLFLARPHEQGRGAGGRGCRPEARRYRRHPLRLFHGLAAHHARHRVRRAFRHSARPMRTPCRSAAPPGSR